MLEENEVEYTYREYRRDPLSTTELRRVLKLLGVKARDVLRRRDRAYKELALSGDESDKVLIPLMAENPTLLERPIGVVGDRAVIGRPPENLLDLI